MSGSRAKTAHYDESLTIRGAAVTTRWIDLHDVERRNVGQPVTRDRNPTESAPGQQDSGAGYEVGGSTRNATALSGLAGAPRGPYVVVLETNEPHHTLATAQALPDLPFFGVIGTTGTGAPIDLYRLTLSAGAESLDFALVADQPVPTQFQVFDGSGQQLGEWSVGGQGTASLHAELGSLSAGSTLYLGITAGNASGTGGPAATVNYQLWINIQSTTNLSTTATAASTTVPSLGFITAIASPLTFSTGLGVVPSSGDSAQVTATSPPNQGDGLRLSAGSPAMRSARPSGGLLSDGDPAPPATRDFNAAVNKEWDERSPSGPSARDGKDVEPTALSGREQEPDALVVTRGPGGFPLLGAVAIGHRRRNPATDVGDFATPPAMAEWDPRVATGLAGKGLLASSDIPATDEGDTAQSQILPDRRWKGFQVSVFSGLGLATVFTLNAVLSQPIAGFDYLTSRLDTDNRPRSYRKGGLRKPGAAPAG